MPNLPRRKKIILQTASVNRNRPKLSSKIPSHKASPLSLAPVNQNCNRQEAHVLDLTSTHLNNKLTRVHFDRSLHFDDKSNSFICTSNQYCVQQPLEVIDQEVTANSNNIDIFYAPLNDFPEELPPDSSAKSKNVPMKPKSFSKLPLDVTSDAKRDNYFNPRRVKLKNQKKTATTNAVSTLFTSEIGTSATELQARNVVLRSVSADSCHSGDLMCRICHGGESLQAELGQLVSACACRGTVGNVHVKCLERWLTESGKSRCELCGTKYSTRRVHKYGVFKASLMWILSHNAKQLMIDSLGIMLMSPLAVLAAWLSGRTLAGLMTQEADVTPWPLASTFVLACMTLVCYYCWIVSAATRHALGWWVWYRAQYEVKLELNNDSQTN